MVTVRRFRITVNGQVFEVEAEELQGSDDREVRPQVERPAESAPEVRPAALVLSPGSTVVVSSPLPGVVLDVKASEGLTVKEGQVLVLLEAMKMENEIVAPVAGVIQEIQVTKGDAVAAGDTLVVLGA